MALVIVCHVLFCSHCNRLAYKRRLFLLSSKFNLHWLDVWTCDCRPNFGHELLSKLLLEWIETLRQLPFISCVWVMLLGLLFCFVPSCTTAVFPFLFVYRGERANRNSAECNGLKHVCIRVWTRDVALARFLCPYKEVVLELIRNKAHKITVTQVYCSSWGSVLT